MTFWIITALIAVGMALTLYAVWSDEFNGWVARILSILWVPVVGFWVWLVLAVGLSSLVAIGMGPNVERAETHGLRAMGGSTEMHGATFLFSGYIGQDEMITYIQENDDGSFQKDVHRASGTKIWEKDGVGPSMTTIEESALWPWIAPFEVPISHRHEFTVPVGSVASSYDLKP